MNIVISTKRFSPMIGGTVNYAAMLARGFSEKGHSVTLITETEGPAEQNQNYKMIRKPSVADKFKLAFSADVLLQVESSWKHAYPFLLLGVPWFPTVHRGYAEPKKPTFMMWLRLTLEKAAYRIGRTIGVSQYVVDSWRLREPAIPNPYDDKLFFQPPENSIRDIDVLFVGSLVKRKGIFILCDALLMLNSPLKIAFVGVGPDLDNLRKRTSEFPHRFEVTIAGGAPPTEVASWMKRSRLLAFPTTSEWLEASPLTPLEAAACGCLVVATDTGGTSENIAEDHWLVSPDSALELSKALRTALDESEKQPSETTLNMLQNHLLERVADLYLARFKQYIRP